MSDPSLPHARRDRLAPAALAHLRRPGAQALADSERQLQGTCTTAIQEAIVRPRRRRHPYGTQNGTWRQLLQGQRIRARTPRSPSGAVPVPDLSGDGDGASVPDLPGGGDAPPSPGVPDLLKSGTRL